MWLYTHYTFLRTYFLVWWWRASPCQRRSITLTCSDCIAMVRCVCVCVCMCVVRSKQFTPHHTHTHTHLTRNYIYGHIYQDFIITHYYMVFCHLMIHDFSQHDLLTPWRWRINSFTAIVDLSRFNNSCLKSPASTLVDVTFQSRALRSFSLNQLRNLSL